MTNKEVKEQLKQIPIHDGVSDNYLKTIYEAIDIAIEALEKEPCEDCISRQEALNIVHKYFEHYLQLNDDICLDGLRSLPSVAPKEKTWHCKDCKWWKDNDGVYRRGIGAESKCPINRKEVYEGNGYCFMFEPQESEEEK